MTDDEDSTTSTLSQAFLLVVVSIAGFYYLRPLLRRGNEEKHESPEEIRQRRALFLAETTTPKARLDPHELPPRQHSRGLRQNVEEIKAAAPSILLEKQSIIESSRAESNVAKEKASANDDDLIEDEHLTTAATSRTATTSTTQEIETEGGIMLPKKKKAKTLPPVQQLCESLSEALEFTVQPTPGSRWNSTEGWRKRLKSPGKANQPLFLVDLSSTAPPNVVSETENEQQEWTDLHHAMSHMAAIPPFPKSATLRVSWAAKAFGNFRIQSQKHPRGSACFRVAEQWVLQWIREAMQTEAAQHKIEDDDDDALPDLFRDESPEPEDVAQTKTMVDDLLNLAETNPVHINGLFLEGLWGDGTAESASQTPLIERVYGRLWMRLGEAWRRNDASVLQERINCVSHIFSQSKRVRALVAIDFAAKDDSSIGTGKEIEEHLPVARLWSIAAYTLPVTFDGTDQPSLFVNQMEKSLLDGDVPENLGIAFFRNQTSSSFHACAKDARALMQAARNVCQVLLKRVMKENDKRDVFNWLCRLAQAK